jgi:hypothetical protein
LRVIDDDVEDAARAGFRAERALDLQVARQAHREMREALAPAVGPSDANDREGDGEDRPGDDLRCSPRGTDLRGGLVAPRRAFRDDRVDPRQGYQQSEREHGHDGEAGGGGGAHAPSRPAGGGATMAASRHVAAELWLNKGGGSAAPPR